MNKNIKLLGSVLIGLICLSGTCFLYKGYSAPNIELVDWIIKNENSLIASYDKNSVMMVPWDLDRDYYLLNNKMEKLAKTKFSKISRIYIAKKAEEDDKILVLYNYQYFIMKNTLAADKFRSSPKMFGVKDYVVLNNLRD